MKKFIIAALGVALAGIGVNAYAATAIGTMSPSLTISSTCTVTSSSLTAFTGLPFKTSGSTDQTTTGSVLVACEGTGYKLGANFGTTPSHSATQRMLLSSTGSADIPYTIDINDGSTTQTNWGDGGITGSTMPSVAAYDHTGTMGTAADSYTLTAKILGTDLDGKLSAVYGDTVTVTVEW